MSSNDACTNGTSRVLTVISLQLLKMEDVIPAPADCEIWSVIKFFNAQNIAPIVIRRRFIVSEPSNFPQISRSLLHKTVTDNLLLINLCVRRVPKQLNQNAKEKSWSQHQLYSSSSTKRQKLSAKALQRLRQFLIVTAHAQQLQRMRRKFVTNYVLILEQSYWHFYSGSMMTATSGLYTLPQKTSSSQCIGVTVDLPTRRNSYISRNSHPVSVSVFRMTGGDECHIVVPIPCDRLLRHGNIKGDPMV